MIKRKNKKQNKMPLKYIAVIRQSGTDAPVATEYENDILFGSFIRDDVGFYSSVSATDFNVNKIWINGIPLIQASSEYTTVWIPVTHHSGLINLRYQIQMYDDGNGKLAMTLAFRDD